MKISLKEIKLFILLAVVLSAISGALRYFFNLGFATNLIISLGFAIAILISFINSKKKDLGIKVIFVYLLFSIFNLILGLLNINSMQSQIPLLYIYLLTIAEIILIVAILLGVYSFRKWGFYLAELYFLYYFLAWIYLQFIIFSGPLYSYYIQIGDIASLVANIGTDILKSLFFLLTIAYLAKIKTYFTK
jgi:hypothetical protein